MSHRGCQCDKYTVIKTAMCYVGLHIIIPAMSTAFCLVLLFCSRLWLYGVTYLSTLRKLLSMGE